MKNAVSWDVTACGECKNKRFAGMYSLHHQRDNNQRARTTLAVTSNTADVPSWLILFTLMLEAIRTSETSVLKRATRRHIPEDGILHVQRLYVSRY
jgi:hypothetical protein